MKGKKDDTKQFVRLVSKGTLRCETFIGEEAKKRQGPTWKVNTLVPALNRRSEQLYIETRNALCSLRNFQNEIKDGKSQLSVESSSIDSIAESICDTWKITDGTQWVVWLLNNWDPMQSGYPPSSTQALSKSFPPWILRQDFLQETKKAPLVCRRATITLHAGISKRDAQRLMDFVLETFNTSKGKGGRPSLTDREREMIHNEFNREGIPRPAGRAAMISKVQKNLIANGCNKISTTTIGNEMRNWLRMQGQPVRRYSPS